MTDLSNILERRINLLYLCYEKDKVTIVTNRKHKVCNHEARLNVLHIVAKRNYESLQDFLMKSLALDRKFYCYTKNNIHLTHISMCLKLYLAKCNFLAFVCFFVNMQKILKWRIPKVNTHLFSYYGIEVQLLNIVLITKIVYYP